MRVFPRSLLPREISSRRKSDLQVVLRLLPSCVVVAVLGAIFLGEFPVRPTHYWDYRVFYFEFATTLLSCVIVGVLLGAALLAASTMLRAPQDVMRSSETE